MYRVEDLLPGDCLLMTSSPRESLPARVLDAAISWSTANPFVHACMVGEGHLIDPLWRVERGPLDRYAANGWCFTVHATDAQRAAAVAWAETRVGERYSVREILEDGARFDLHLIRPAWYSWRRKAYTCSGFTMAAWAAAGVVLSRAPAVAPSDLSYSPLLLGPRPWEPHKRGG